MKKQIIITVEAQDENGTKFNTKAKGLHHFEVLGLLRTAILLAEQEIIEKNN